MAGFEFHADTVRSHGSKLVSAGSGLTTSIWTDMAGCGSSTVAAAAHDYFFWASAQLLLASEAIGQHGQNALDACTHVDQGDATLAQMVEADG
jgi:hypothetical protein